VLAEDVRLDEDNPWPGLGPFDEAAQRFFNGRDAEAAALRRLVLEAPLTLLFSRSGLGKTSLLKAGLFPLLRLDHVLPVYVRLDVRDRKRPLVEQIADALLAEIASSGGEATAARADGESLWRYLHRSDFEIWSQQNHPLTPVVVLDQFEEVFTLGAMNAPAVDAFRTELGDLVENRIPVALSRQAETTEAASRDLALHRQRYKVLLSFREDFLPALEGWKKDLPSVMRNRLRLLPLDGARAFEAVHKTAPSIAPAPIARRIVSMVAAARADGRDAALHAAGHGATPAAGADGADVEGLVVEPALLSLVCRRLNERRKKHGKPAFDDSLLTGAVPAILDEFYRACLDDQPDRLRRFVAEALITEGGFRNLYAVDDARRAYGITDDELRTLVNRRLLRVEPYQGVDRVELIHDVLTPRVREERERFREADRKEQKRKRQRRHRVGLMVAGVVLVAVGAVSLAVWAIAQRRTAEARRIAAVGSARVGSNPEVAAWLALSSLQVKPTAEAEGVLRRALFGMPLLRLEGQRQPIRRVAFSPDSQRLAVGGAGESVWVWQAGPRWVPRGLRLAGRASDVLQWSPDGKELVTGGEKVTFWDPATGASIRDILPPRHRGSRTGASEVAFNRSGTALAIVWNDDTIAISAIRDATTPRMIGVPQDHEPVAAVAFTPDDKQLVAVSVWGRALLVWDLHPPDRPLRVVPLDLTLPVRTAELNASGETLAIGGGVPPEKNQRGRGFVRLVSAGDGDTIREFFGGHENEVLDVAFGADGRTLISAGLDGVICTWDIADGALISQRRAHAGPVRTIGVAAEGDLFASGGDDAIARIWSGRPLPEVGLAGHSGQVASVAFTPDGESLVTGGIDGTVRLWSAVDGTPLRTLLGHRSHVYAVAVSPDGQLLASAGGSALAGEHEPGGDTAIRLWNRADGTLAREIADNRQDVMAAAFSTDGRELATAGVGPNVSFWDVATGRLVRQLTTKNHANGALSYSDDGTLLAAAGDDGVARVWQPASGRLVAELREPRSILTAAAFGRGGSRLLTTSVNDSEIIVWDVAAKRIVQRFAGLAGANHADFSRSGMLALAAETDGAPRLWDVPNGAMLASLIPARAVWSVSFSPDMRRIAAGSFQGGGHVWSCELCGASVTELQDIARQRLGRMLDDTELHVLLAE
jgi:WD40 repeat protein